MADQKRYLDLDGLTAFWGKIKEKMAPIDDSRFITDSERSKLSLIADGAEVNQNAFAKIT